ncbi:holo-ACP synthase [Leptolyngbya sp. AN03gr2]|uniref:holo-ACP synthase n=1 Tax=unclassified Leptolyngbya TaxID=2650499 RepID=UPI003D314F07
MRLTTNLGLLYAMLIVRNSVQKVHRFSSNALSDYDTAFLSDYEYQYCSRKANPAASRAGIWCAKAALIEAINELYTCEATAQFFPLERTEVEIRHELNGRPKVELSDRIKQWCDQQGITIEVSISHAGDYAAAGVLIRRSNLSSRQAPCSP